MKIDLIQRMFRIDREHSKTWRREAIERFDFYQGRGQWTDEDRAYLEEHNRPVITFNRASVIINSVAGNEIQNRKDIQYSPVEMGDVQANEVLSEAAKWFRSKSRASTAESDAFKNTLICGMGWTETTISFEEDEQGEPAMNTLDPLQMFWDASARDPNLSDASRVWRAKTMSVTEAKAMFPDKTATELHASWAGLRGVGAMGAEPHDADPENAYTDDSYSDSEFQDSGEDDEITEVTILHLQIKERQLRYTVTDPQTGKRTHLTEEEYNRLNSRMTMMGQQSVEAIQSKRIVYMQYWIGSDILDQAELPVDKFMYQCITGYKDHIKGLWYGLLEIMMDPQRWANKWLSQSMHIFNSLAKGGVMAERGAVEDEKQFENSWSKTEAVTWLNSGGLTKIQEKPHGNVPSQLLNMVEFAITSIREVTGVNTEMLGQRDAIQPMGLEKERKVSGMTILAPMFDSMRLYREMNGFIILQFLQRYLNDGRLIKIAGVDGEQFVPLAVNQDQKFDITIDESPSSPDVKDRVWALVAPMIGNLPPQVMSELLQFSPLPAPVVTRLQKVLGAITQPDPMQQQMQQLELQKQGADIGMTQASSQKALADAEKLRAEAQKSQSDVAKTSADIENNAVELMLNTMDRGIQNAQRPRTNN
jgi:hypothetical protein